MQSIKSALRKVTELILPTPLFTKIISIRSRNYQHRFLQRQGLDIINRQFIDNYGTTVLHGLFSGMTYPQESLAVRHSIPKLLGSYEMELHSSLDAIILNAKSQYECVIDIGSAEGYYAVGLALKTDLPVIAFDTEPRELDFCKKMAILNDVAHQMTFKNWCSSQYLSELNKRCFIMCDCEGYEAILFDEVAIRGLSRSDLLIELHDTQENNITDPLIERFSVTHTAKLISSQPRNPDSFPELNFLNSKDNALKAISEYRREGQRWVLFRAKSQS
ncbi:MAG: hypothetical protein NW237_13630 [Cyanobacteriota bacterium]|nr:hypothetical protein [Cyanobacteriota bacterium]